MAYTLSVVAANGENGGKIKFKNNGMQYRHTFRNSLEAEQFKDGFKNKNIDWDRTHLNNDFINPEYSENGTLNIEDAIKNKFEKEYNGKRKVRSDAVVVREMIIQLKHDDLDFEDMNEAEQDDFIYESERAYKGIVEHLNEDVDGNVIGGSIHYDETNPHMHVMVVPITPDGRLSQKDYFKPKDYKRRVKELREVANEHTSDDFVVNQENKLPKGVKGVRNAEFVKNAVKIEAERRILKEEQDDIEAEVYHTVRSEMKEKLSKDEDLLNDVRKEVKEHYEPLIEATHQRHLELLEKERKEKEKEIKEAKKKRIAEILEDNFDEDIPAFIADYKKMKADYTEMKSEVKHLESKKLSLEKLNKRERNLDLRERLLDRESIEKIKSDAKADIAYHYADNLAAMTAIRQGDKGQALEILSRPFTSDISSEKSYIPGGREAVFIMADHGLKLDVDNNSVVKLKGNDGGMIGVSYEPSRMLNYHRKRQEKARQEKERTHKKNIKQSSNDYDMEL